MKKVVAFLFVVLFVGCSDYDYKITSLNRKVMKYDELPSELKRFLSIRPKCEDYDMLLFVELADSVSYSLDVIDTWYGPWVDYVKLKDNSKGVSYRINQDIPDPFIILKNKLYIPDRYDILCGGSVFEAIYTEYQLK